MPVVGGTGCRMTGTENFGDLILCKGREGREEWNACGWRLVVDKWCRELIADGCNLIGEIAGKVVNQGRGGRRWRRGTE